MQEPRWERSFSEPHVRLTCRCGWTGHDDDIEDWAIETEYDRVVRRCPDCGNAVLEWGALQPIDGAAQIARGPLRDSLVASGHLEE